MVDGDDWVDKKKFAQLLSYLKEIDTDLVITGYYWVDEHTGKKTIERPNIQLEMQFETSEKDTIKEFMEEVDPLNLTPLEAINKLYELKELIKGG